MPEHVADADDVVHELTRLRGVHAGSRLVKQQQARIRRQCADDLESSLRAIRKRARLVVRHILHVENAEKLQRALLCDALLAPVLRQAEHCRTERVFRLVVKADENVVEHRQIAEQADILEGSGNAHLVDLNGGLPCCVHAVEQDGTARRLIDLGKKVKTVVLPAPFGPIRPAISVLPMAKLKSLTADKPPKSIPGGALRESEAAKRRVLG